MTGRKRDIPMITERLELFAQTPEGLPLWKTKGLQLNCENLLENVLVLSNDIAHYFGIRHDHLVSQNISKSQKEGYLSDHLPKFREMVTIGSSAKRSRIVYGLTRHQTEHLIMDFYGIKAESKKHIVLSRLQAIESDILRGAYTEAREKACTWDGVQLLKDSGFISSIGDKLATKKDIARFLQVPEGTLTTFLRRHADQILPVALDWNTIVSIGSKARRMYGYTWDDVFKIIFWMDSKVSVLLKEKILGDVALHARPGQKTENEWGDALAKVFAGFGFKRTYTIGKYRVDFFVQSMLLALECDADDHRYYDSTNEKEREQAISQHYTLIRFNPNISWETLINAILKARPKEIIKLYTTAKAGS